MNEADKIYRSCIGGQSFLQLFGAHKKRHPVRWNSWQALLNDYFTAIETKWLEIATSDASVDEREVQNMLKAMTYIYRSKMLQHTKNVMSGPLALPLLTPSVMKDLLLLFTPRNEKDSNEVASWKEAWTAITGAEEFRTVVCIDDMRLGHGVVGMNNKYSRFTFEDSADCDDIPWRRSSVFLQNRHAGFQHLMALAQQHRTTYGLGKRVAYDKCGDYACRMSRTNVATLIGCIEDVVEQWVKGTDTTPAKTMDQLTMHKIIDTHSLSENEAEYMEIVWAMLTNSESAWRSLVVGRQPKELIRDIFHVLGRLQWWNRAFSEPAIYRFRHEWLKIAAGGRTQEPISWYPMEKGPEGWDDVNTEAHDRLALEINKHFQDDLAISKSFHHIRTILEKSEAANYCFDAVDDLGETAEYQVLDETIAQGLNYINAGLFKMKHIRNEKIKDPLFDERTCNEVWAIAETKKAGQWIESSTKPSERNTHWNRFTERMATELGEHSRGVLGSKRQSTGGEKQSKKPRTR
ncbi:hypothetical protein BDZ89DRAFT_260856 [Hymenopellis radicata]|nr:hypothetical protein BDZ89DRAFT_260856 [Hymenopellis radicata]